MAPQPLTTTIRTSRHGASQPAIYAIHSGPQRGVHLLSPRVPRADPLPASIQYLYRHPINVHRTFLTVTGDFLRRRFDSIDAATKWIDERDRERELSDALEATTLTPSAAPPPTNTTPPPPQQQGSNDDSDIAALVSELQELREQELAPSSPIHARARRASDPVFKFAPQSMSVSGVVDGGRVSKTPSSSPSGVKDRKRVVAVRGKYGMSHLGVRRRELLYSLVAPDDDGADEDVRRRERLAVLGGVVGVGGPTGMGSASASSSSGGGGGGSGGGDSAMEIEEEL
ncbi:hypothetical protein BZA05DRAFT_415604 [Tricharina praecox]|uniref:uncharacterized protein n=1 Tax=Tricharina praecox TaxID=43433 RepID=UPI00221FE76E|nr:uncharacterized protein BZA05DRAFT_415604 [Tricharina praecox]KAI5856881.1 hypothetical protein BZA05DRAFT_415604 [Tricharina praecox]